MAVGRTKPEQPGEPPITDGRSAPGGVDPGQNGRPFRPRPQPGKGAYRFVFRPLCALHGREGVYGRRRHCLSTGPVQAELARGRGAACRRATHRIQQKAGSPFSPQDGRIASRPNDPSQVEAETMARDVARAGRPGDAAAITARPAIVNTGFWNAKNLMDDFSGIHQVPG